MAPGGVEPPRTDSKSVALSAELRGPTRRVADGTRTHDHLDHNQGLYTLSYGHRAHDRIAPVLERLTLAKSTQHFSRLNQGLYQLSYRHRGRLRIAASRPGGPSFRRRIRRPRRRRRGVTQPPSTRLQ